MKTNQSKSAKLALIASLFIVGLASNTAWAGGGHHGHGHGGGHWHGGFSLNIGAPFFWPYYAYAPVYYPQPVVVAPAPQVVYIEQAQAPIAPPQAQQYWYYCGNPQGYYPNVQQCPAGWQKVLPQQVR
ncbi:MAG: hypothetical protein RL020_1639 [Pseudomonadota bacterium]|jgi:hypothetical protein